MSFPYKDLLGLENLDAAQITEILDNAVLMKDLFMQNAKKMPHLNGKSVITLFYENSTRTRMSFELAGKFLGASTSSVSASSSSVQKGETLIDTGKTLDAMGTDIIIIRHPMSGAPALLARNVRAGVINAGDGMHEHPTQALLDIFTMREKKGGISGLKVAIIGDAYHSRVVRSNIWGLTKLGADVTVCAPGSLMPFDIGKMGARVCYDMREAACGADVVMGLRIQLERQKGGLFPTLNEYNELYGISGELVDIAAPGALVMHPGPMNRGVEINSDVADSEASVINEQVTNGVAVRMALLYMMTRKGEHS